jgi:hypothetical protein
MVEALAAVAIIGVAALGIGSMLSSIGKSRLKNQTVSQMIELEARIVRAIQNYNTYECNVPAGGITAKQALINAVQSTAGLGTILEPLAGFTIPLITPTSATVPPGLCATVAAGGPGGITLAGAGGVDGKTYFDIDLNPIGTTTPPNGSVFEVLADVKCDGPAYNVATDNRKSCAMAYQIRVVDDPANPGRNNVNLVPIGTMVWNPASGAGFPTRAAATAFAAGIGGSDYNFTLTTDVFRKVDVTAAVTNFNSCQSTPNALFVTGYDRDSATVNCATKAAVDPGCAPNEVPVGLRYDVATGEVKTNCVSVFQPVRCLDNRYVLQKVDLKALDSRYPAPVPPGVCTWAGAQTAAAPASLSHVSGVVAKGWVDVDLCPANYSTNSAGCSVTPSGGSFTPGVCTEYLSSTWVPPPAPPCTGYSYCALGTPPGPPAWQWGCPVACPSGYYSCDTGNTATYASTDSYTCTCTVTGNRAHCTANAPSALCSGGGSSTPTGCSNDFVSTAPTWTQDGLFKITYSCLSVSFLSVSITKCRFSVASLNSIFFLWCNSPLASN